MDKEHKCDAHGESVTAYCREHKVLLCTKCFINKVHKVEDCELCETQTLLPTDILYLNLKSLEKTIKERIAIQKAEQKSLEDLHKALENQVETCYGSLIASLEEMKQKTLDYLDKSIDRRNVAVVRRSDVLVESQAKVLKHMAGVGCNTKMESQDPINVEEIEKELKSLKAKVDKSSTSFLNPIEGTFIPYKAMLTFPDKVLGDIEFSDELYEYVSELDHGPPQAAKDHLNATSYRTNDLDSIQVNDRDVDGGLANSVVSETAAAYEPDKRPAVPPRKAEIFGKSNLITNESDAYATVAKNRPSSDIPPTEAEIVGKYNFITDGSDDYATVVTNLPSRDISYGDAGKYNLITEGSDACYNHF